MKHGKKKICHPHFSQSRCHVLQAVFGTQNRFSRRPWVSQLLTMGSASMCSHQKNTHGKYFPRVRKISAKYVDAELSDMFFLTKMFANNHLPRGMAASGSNKAMGRKTLFSASTRSYSTRNMRRASAKATSWAPGKRDHMSHMCQACAVCRNTNAAHTRDNGSRNSSMCGWEMVPAQGNGAMCSQCSLFEKSFF